MTANRFTVDSDGKYWDRLSHKYVTIDHLFYLVEKLEKENEELKKQREELFIRERDTKNDWRELKQENEKLKSFIDDLTTKGTGRIDLANGYSYRVNAVLTNWKGEVE